MALDHVELAWKEFIDGQVIPSALSPIIANSWRRSWGHVNLSQKLCIAQLSSEHLLAAQIASFDFISVVRPIMEDIYQCVERSNTSMILVNGAGYVLDLLGDQEMLKVLQQLGIRQGSLLSEEHIGTNALGLALTEQTPVRVVGAEHYHQEFHQLAGAAAPIFDLSGRPLGALGLFTYASNYHAHSLGLVAAGARAIEGQKRSDTLLEEQNNQLAQLNAILSTINDGIAVWNSEHTLIHVNAAASDILGKPVQSLVGKRVEPLFSTSSFVIEAIQQNKHLSDVEISITLDERTINCFISLHFVLNKKNNGPQWGIATLRTEKDVRRLVQHQIGANAMFTLDDIPGDSVQMQQVRRFVQSAADAEASILVHGEVGTGKNVLANAIHNASRRRDGPFVIFACSSIPNELAINELLGHDESLGPAGLGGRPSKFELAQSGTLFFQDIDALPLEAQSVLLNVLEMGFVQRLGSRRPIEVDVRVIASTHVDMEALIAQGSFRPDLFYRLSTFAILLPPLRERPGDIPLIVDRILHRLSYQLGYSFELGLGIMDVLKRCVWPGNVRELESVLGRAAMQVGPKGVIELTHLPGSIFYVAETPKGPQAQPTVQPLAQIERETILRTTQLCRGNVTQMALALGISRTTLWRKLKEFSIQAKDYRPG